VGRDIYVTNPQATGWVSIHAPRVGRDRLPLYADAIYQFQFTRPAWGATMIAAKYYVGFVVSIHAPRVGRDGGYCNTFSCSKKGE